MHGEVVMKAKAAKQAASILRITSTGVKNKALDAMANALEDNMKEILEANAEDIAAAQANGLSSVLIERLTLNENRILGMANGVREVAQLSDPVGETIDAWKLPNGLEISKVRVPLGVVGMIYESRPNVTVDAAALCLKAGNAVVLRGGSEAIHSNTALWRIIASAAYKAQIPEGAIQLIETVDREAVGTLLKLNEYIDVLIPRGGHSLIQRVVKEATVPVIETGVGNCHVYVDEDADLAMAVRIVENAKCQRPGVCNAMETLLVHRAVAEEFLPLIAHVLKERNVELRGCTLSKAIVPEMKEAVEEDWSTEYLDLVLAVKVVESMDEAIEHIAKFGTKHSEAIITKNYFRAREFTRSVDAAAVYVNASTRFTDGQQFGMGAEIGISTQNLHARGPMGLKELTTNKYIVCGEGQIRE